MKLKNFIKDILFNRERHFFLKAFSLLLNDTKISLLDIGAAGDIEPRWKKISSFLNYIGVEPDERSYENLKKKKYKCFKYTIIPKALWSSLTSIKYNQYKGWEQSSHFKPNLNFTSKFPQNERFNIDKTKIIEVDTIDNLIKETVDFIKIDTQGAELEIIKGAKDKITKVLGLEIELGVASIYQGQPLFHDIYKKMKELNFEFIDFTSIRRWERFNNNTSYGQIIFGDGLFLRSPEYILKKHITSKKTIKKYMAIIILYNRFDLLDRLNILLEKKHPETILQNKNINYVLRKRFDRVKKINKLFNIFLKLFGYEYSNHILY
jgi:FkbM family methyltransferase